MTERRGPGAGDRRASGRDRVPLTQSAADAPERESRDTRDGRDVRDGRGARPSRRRLLLLSLFTAVVLGGALLGSFPARSIAAQRTATNQAETRLGDLDAEISRLQARVDQLGQSGEIERIAREKYGYVPPGTESYRVITPSAGDVPVPHGWPFLLTTGR